MARSFNQKLKILYLMKVLKEKSDREHPMCVQDIINHLEGYGISVERKTVYDDIETLRLFGMNIAHRRERPSGYFLVDRDFEFSELKILVDAVESSKFITEYQSRELIRKLERLTSSSESRKLHVQKYMTTGTRAVNGEIYMTIERICNAIDKNCQIAFQYYEWDFSKSLRPKRNGEKYHVSPWKLIWKSENYYLVGLDEKKGMVKHYRVDKIMHVTLRKDRRNGEDIFNNFDIEKFVSGTFGMYGGKDTYVRMEFENNLVGVVLDRFGQNTMLIPRDAEHFSIQVRINVSTQFFGWLSGLGKGAVIVSPENVRRDYISFLKRALRNYEDVILTKK